VVDDAHGSTLSGPDARAKRRNASTAPAAKRALAQALGSLAA